MSAIVLIGPMGAGKTSIGRRVAKALGVSFYDSDAAVVREHGAIEEIFVEHGEAYFRDLERRAVQAGLERGGVVALGGGAILDPATRRDLAEHRVVLLTVAPRTVAGRVKDSARPLLQGSDALARWEQIYAERRPLYEAAADVTFDTSRGPLQGIVTAVVAWANDAERHDDAAIESTPDSAVDAAINSEEQ